MTYLTGEVTVIHTNTQADFENFTYSAIYANLNGTYTINGTAVIMVAGDTLEVVVEAPPATVLNAGYILLGNPSAPQALYPTGVISATTENFQNNIGLVKTYQFVDIKTGGPTQAKG